uniref:ShKT domain-containing protein n=1 Tax=Strongyloides venezuelensis TaxID=75913 RepID=A0A0K0FAL4_STRVS
MTIALSAYTTTIGNCEKGYCPKDYSCISNYCVKGAIQANPTTSGSSTTVKPTFTSCNDKITTCSSVKNLCTNSIYKKLLQQQCQKSCNYC